MNPGQQGGAPQQARPNNPGANNPGANNPGANNPGANGPGQQGGAARAGDARPAAAGRPPAQGASATPSPGAGANADQRRAGDLFRPSSDQAKRGGGEPQPGGRPVERPGGDRTALVPTVQPAPISAQRLGVKPAGGGANEPATTGNPPRPASGPRPDGARPEPRKDGQGASAEPGRQGSGPSGGPAANGAERSASASRSG
jgi:hypothetical protein